MTTKRPAPPPPPPRPHARQTPAIVQRMAVPTPRSNGLPPPPRPHTAFQGAAVQRAAAPVPRSNGMAPPPMAPMRAAGHACGSVVQGNFRAGAPAVAQANGANRKGDAWELPSSFSLPSHGGQRLPEPVLAKMQSFFKTDFSGVRVHVGPQAQAIGAIAFTVGETIVFAPGHYDPHSVRGQQLLGHELTHVVQQRAGRVRNPFGKGLSLVQNTALEAEADRMGQMAAVQRATVTPGFAGTAPAMRPTTSAIQAQKGGKKNKVDSEFVFKRKKVKAERYYDAEAKRIVAQEAEHYVGDLFTTLDSLKEEINQLTFDYRHKMSITDLNNKATNALNRGDYTGFTDLLYMAGGGKTLEYVDQENASWTYTFPMSKEVFDDLAEFKHSDDVVATFAKGAANDPINLFKGSSSSNRSNSDEYDFHYTDDPLGFFKRKKNDFINLAAVAGAAKTKIDNIVDLVKKSAYKTKPNDRGNMSPYSKSVFEFKKIKKTSRTKEHYKQLLEGRKKHYEALSMPEAADIDEYGTNLDVVDFPDK